MTHVLWLTEDRTLQPEIESAVSFADATLVIVNQLHDLPPSPVDIILWSPTTYDERIYLTLTRHCHQVLQLIERDQHHTRLCPITSRGAPRYYIVCPFDPEEAGVIIRGFAERAKKRGLNTNERLQK